MYGMTLAEMVEYGMNDPAEKVFINDKTAGYLGGELNDAGNTVTLTFMPFEDCHGRRKTVVRLIGAEALVWALSDPRVGTAFDDLLRKLNKAPVPGDTHAASGRNFAVREFLSTVLGADLSTATR
jgi:hypothetical protein